MSRMISCISTLALLTATLAGCSEGRAPRAADEVQPPAPVVATAPVQASAPIAASSYAAPPIEGPAKAATAASPAPATRRAGAPEVAGKLRIKRLVLADEVKGREPVEPKTSFQAAETDRIYAFVEVENGAVEETEITVSFEPPDGGATRGNVTLSVGASPRWRTWAFTRGARVAGAWTAVVRAPDGSSRDPQSPRGPSHRTGLVGLTSGSSGRRGPRPPSYSGAGVSTRSYPSGSVSCTGAMMARD